MIENKSGMIRAQHNDRKWDTKSNSNRSGGWATVTGTLTRPLGEIRFESGVPGGSEATESGAEVEKLLWSRPVMGNSAPAKLTSGQHRAA
ncbi:hypothetical protein WN55_10313 [Dufourea novaeangliae]|uniref:Uncharacterized protein n=1 Tax=Dufourea novaeangliae TaxID=178035 RepID=A0A154P3J7_DUFNO|nr:hypothetical protein WN55_10313 [Dufourea novaeangliae]